MMEKAYPLAQQNDPLGGGRSRTAGRETGMEFWRVDRVARYLDVSKKRVYQLVQEKRLQAIRLGPRQMRILKKSLEAYVSDLTARSQEEEL